jgi:hypothetical protein
MAVTGLLFFLFPVDSARVWPWPLPPLAARFLGALFLAGAVCSMVCLRVGRPGALFVMRLVALGDALIALAALLAIAQIGLTPAMAVLLVFFLGIAVFLVWGVRAPFERSAHGAALPGLLRAFFLVHLLVVLPVGCAMFFAPDWAQPLWPWRMTPLNVRLLGAFFLGAATISLWALRTRAPGELVPVVALYALFATLATVAAVLHIGLFDLARTATWAFFGLYVFVAAGSWIAWWWLTSDRGAQRKLGLDATG